MIDILKTENIKRIVITVALDLNISKALKPHHDRKQVEVMDLKHHTCFSGMHASSLNIPK